MFDDDVMKYDATVIKTCESQVESVHDVSKRSRCRLLIRGELFRGCSAFGTAFASARNTRNLYFETTKLQPLIMSQGQHGSQYKPTEVRFLWTMFLRTT